jgi:hypothetical protein
MGLAGTQGNNFERLVFLTLEVKKASSIGE